MNIFFILSWNCIKHHKKNFFFIFYKVKSKRNLCIQTKQLEIYKDNNKHQKIIFFSQYIKTNILEIYGGYMNSENCFNKVGAHHYGKMSTVLMFPSFNCITLYSECCLHLCYCYHNLLVVVLSKLQQVYIDLGIPN